MHDLFLIFFAHQRCISFFENSIKFWNIITILNNCFLLEYI